ncbi:hypothetical protein HK096_006205, partial [Nowakowskiella sp. JEL0078]
MITDPRPKPRVFKPNSVLSQDLTSNDHKISHGFSLVSNSNHSKPLDITRLSLQSGPSISLENQITSTGTISLVTASSPPNALPRSIHPIMSSNDSVSTRGNSMALRNTSTNTKPIESSSLISLIPVNQNSNVENLQNKSNIPQFIDNDPKRTQLALNVVNPNVARSRVQSQGKAKGKHSRVNSDTENMLLSVKKELIEAKISESNAYEFENKKQKLHKKNEITIDETLTSISNPLLTPKKPKKKTGWWYLEEVKPENENIESKTLPVTPKRNAATK